MTILLLLQLARFKFLTQILTWCQLRKNVSAIKTYFKKWQDSRLETLVREFAAANTSQNALALLIYLTVKYVGGGFSMRHGREVSGSNPVRCRAIFSLFNPSRSASFIRHFLFSYKICLTVQLEAKQ